MTAQRTAQTSSRPFFISLSARGDTARTRLGRVIGGGGAAASPSVCV